MPRWKRIAATLALLLVTGCSNEPSRSLVRDLIVEKYNFPHVCDADLFYGSRYTALAIRGRKLDSELQAVVDRGLLVATLTKQEAHNDLYRLNASAEGLKYIYGNPQRVKLGEAVFVEVTGLTLVDENARIYEVEYTWKCANLTPWANAAKKFAVKPLETGRCTLGPHNDSWRILR